jgi:hypothetical protein
VSLGCACADDLRREPAPASRRERTARRSSAAHGHRIGAFVMFVLRTFYVLAIRRCKPGPVRWP